MAVSRTSPQSAASKNPPSSVPDVVPPVDGDESLADKVAEFFTPKPIDYPIDRPFRLPTFCVTSSGSCRGLLDGLRLPTFDLRPQVKLF